MKTIVSYSSPGYPLSEWGATTLTWPIAALHGLAEGQRPSFPRVTYPQAVLGGTRPSQRVLVYRRYTRA